MIFEESPIRGAYVVRLEPLVDQRGFFARSWCHGEFENAGLDSDLSQCNISFNNSRGTLRGMHFQAQPHGETKLVRCVRGRIYDVIIDLRRESQSYMDHFAIELGADNRLALYVPKGFAHGFLTLTDDAEVHYQMSDSYVADAGRGVRWNDPAFGIEWPAKVRVISERDSSYPNLEV